MNLLIGLLPALFWGMLPLCVARIGGRPTQQIMGTTLGTLAVAVLFSGSSCSLKSTGERR